MSFHPPTTSETLLDFVLETTPDPPQVSPQTDDDNTLTLTLVASAPESANQVYCESVQIEFDVAATKVDCEDASYLTCGGKTIVPQATPASDWVPGTEDPYGTYTFLRPSNVDWAVVKQEGKTKFSQGYSFEIPGIAVSPVVGTAQVTVTETSSPDDPKTCTPRTAVFDVPKFPAEFKSVTFKADSKLVDANGSTTLHWEGGAAPGVVYTLSWEGQQPIGVEAKGSRPTPELTEDTQFTLTVTYHSGGKKVVRPYNVLIEVRSAKLAIAADSDTVFGGGSATLFLTIEHATDCQLHGGPTPVSIDPKQIVNGRAQVSVTPPTGTTDYYLSGRDAFSHEQKQSDQFRVTVTPVVADLIFIKTANTQGKVEIHVDDAAHGYQKRAVDVVSAFDAADGPNGTWLVTNFRSELPAPGTDVAFIKTRNTPAGQVVLSVQFGGSSGIDIDGGGSGFAASDGPNGTWLLALMSSPYHFYFQDLVFIKTKGTTSRHVELYSDNPYSGNGSWTSLYPATDTPQGTWLLADVTGKGSDARPPDLVFIQTMGTDKVELRYATAASSFGQEGGHWVTDFDTGEAANGTWTMADMTGDGRQDDLVFVKTRNTESKRVEVYFFTAADNYASHQGGPTEFDVAEGPNGTWQVAPWR